MQANKLKIQTLKKTMKNPSSIRNVCILAHVDHGKTTLADSLLATNGLVNKRSAGQVRYLDDRVDEQQRGITMKSSAVSLHYTLGDEDMVLNLIDTPGHIDFSTEVSAAVRICDGALIVVDVVEGVCSQTRDAIKQAYDECVKMILVLNKIDCLVIKLHREPDALFQNILRIIEDCNVVIAELCHYDAENVADVDEFLFSPDKDNVIFACATDGWAVTTKSLSEALYDVIEGETAESLNRKMWNFDCYIDSDTRRIKTGAISKKYENVFTQLFLKTIHFLYFKFVIQEQREKLPRVLERLKITNLTRDMNHKCPRLQVKAILQAWSPIAQIIMRQCYNIIPSPVNINERKLHCLVSKNRYFGNKEFNHCIDHMLDVMRDPTLDTCIVYISKTFSVDKRNLSQNKPKMFVPSRVRGGTKNLPKQDDEKSETVFSPPRTRGRAAKLQQDPKVINKGIETNNETEKKKNSDALEIGSETYLEKLSIKAEIEELDELGGETEFVDVSEDMCKTEGKFKDVVSPEYTITSAFPSAPENIPKKVGVEKNPAPENVKIPIDRSSENTIMALGRVFGGTLKANSEIYILNSDYDPLKLDEIEKVTLEGLYMMLGREYLLVDEITFGNICGIGGLDDLVLRTATLSSSTYCLPLTEHIHMEPIVRNTIEPVNLRDLPTLRQALKYLTQSDSCVQVIMQETGEHVLVTAGDVHLAKCLEDLKSKFIDFEINVSRPTVLLRETIFTDKTFDESMTTTVQVKMHEVGITFHAMVFPIPDEIQSFLTANYKLLQMIEEHRQSFEDLSEHTRNVVNKLQVKLIAAFSSASDIWGNVTDKIWSVGKSKDTINLLINYSDDYTRDIFTHPDENDPRSAYDHQIVNGFEMCCRAGPICEEALANCCFFIFNYRMDEPAKKPGPGHVQAASNVPLIVRNTLREAFLRQPQRLMEPVFATDIQVSVNILGKVYSVVNKRHGKVLEAVGMDKEEKTFSVKAQIPVIESDGFANEIRKATSGNANPTLRFSHYEIIEADPYFEGDTDDTKNACADDLRANKLVKEIRRRKGLLIDEQIVVHAEKQRTLNKKK